MSSQPWPSVRKNQINCSSSKAMYLFSREKRFRTTSKTLCDSFYNIPSHIGKSQSSGIGKGNKVSINRKIDSPSPNRYNIKSKFQQKTIGGKIALGRQNIKYGGIFQQSETPEPSRYNINRQLSNSKRGFSLKPKLQFIQPSFLKNPGPGHYNSLSTLNLSGKYVVSNLKNCPGTKIMKTKDYNTEQYRNIPGPGAYQLKENINPVGNYFNSKFQNSRCRIFSKSTKNNGYCTNKIPGPGAYNYFSEFGAKK